MSHFRRALLNRVKHFEGRNQFVATENFDAQPAPAHLADTLCEMVGARAETWEIPGPRGHHFPFELFLRSVLSTFSRGFRLTATAGQQTGSARETRAGQEFSSFHDFYLACSVLVPAAGAWCYSGKING